MTLRAEIMNEVSGQTLCCAAGIEVRARAPVLALCRKLVAAGHDPATRLEVYRGTCLALLVRSIGEGAGLMVAENDRGGPWFTPWKAPPSSRGSAEDSVSEPEGTCIAPGANAALPGPRHGEACP
jgi:hypothetical protein